jgi:hypothetical protein
MKEVEDYLARAIECREIAQRALPQHRDTLEQIAKTWETLAAQRLKELQG